MNRRGFLGAILAAGAAPAIVHAANIMPVFMRKEVGGLLVPNYTATELVGNRLITIEEITREALRILGPQLSFMHAINRSYKVGL